jgi:hypothetical protein
VLLLEIGFYHIDRWPCVVLSKFQQACTIKLITRHPFNGGDACWLPEKIIRNDKSVGGGEVIFVKQPRRSKVVAPEG